MCETVSPTSPYHRLARYHDKLGWDNFLEGRFCTLYVELHRRHLRTASRWNLAESWAKELAVKLLQITHRQWLYRNATVHFTSEGHNIRQHEAIIRKVEDLRWIDPDDLLPESQHLLTEDFTLLHAGHTEDKEHWIAEMESTMAAAASKHARQCQRHHRPATPLYSSRTEDRRRWRSLLCSRLSVHETMGGTNLTSDFLLHDVAPKKPLKLFLTGDTHVTSSNISPQNTCFSPAIFILP